MRIGIDVSPVTLHPTGVGQYTASLLRHLRARLGADTLLGLSSGLRPMDTAALAPLDYHRHLPLPTRGLYHCWNTLRIPRADRLLGGVEVYHATNYFLPPVARAACVLTIYDLAFLKMPAVCSPRIVAPFSRNIRRFAAQADAILTCSQASKEDIVTLCGVDPAKITVAYGAVDPAFVPLDREKARAWMAARYAITAPFLLFVGSLEPRKNVEGLIRAFARLAPEIPHALVLAGAPGWKAEGIPALVASLGLEHRIRRIGYVPAHAELPLLYSAAEAFVFPSFYEGFGLPVLEAMACGCPVIASNTAALPEVTAGAALHTDPHDEAALAETMRRMLGDEHLRVELATRGRRRAAQFSWDHTARVTLEGYRKAAACAS